MDLGDSILTNLLLPGNSQNAGRDLGMPIDFPLATHNQFRSIAQKLLLAHASNDLWQEFGTSSTAVQWRYRAGWEHAEKYKLCHPKLSNAEEIYTTEKHFFGAYFNMISAVESMSYSLHALLSFPHLLNLTFAEKQRAHSSPKVLERLVAPFGNAKELHRVLHELNSSPYWRACYRFRNRMAHRSNIPRIVNMSAGNPTAPAFALAKTSNTPESVPTRHTPAGLNYFCAEVVRVLSRAGINVLEGGKVDSIPDKDSNWAFEQS